MRNGVGGMRLGSGVGVSYLSIVRVSSEIVKEGTDTLVACKGVGAGEIGLEEAYRFGKRLEVGIGVDFSYL